MSRPAPSFTRVLPLPYAWLARLATELWEQPVHHVGQLGAAGGEVSLEVAREFAGRLVTFSQIQRERLLQHVGGDGRQSGQLIELGVRGTDRRLDQAVEHGLVLVEELRGQAVVEDDARREQVRAQIDGLAARLL